MEQSHQIAEIETAIIVDISSIMVLRPDTRSAKEETRKQGHIRVRNLPVAIDITTNTPRRLQVKKETFALAQGQRIPNPQRSLSGTSAARSEKTQMLSRMEYEPSGIDNGSIHQNLATICKSISEEIYVAAATDRNRVGLDLVDHDQIGRRLHIRTLSRDDIQGRWQRQDLDGLAGKIKRIQDLDHHEGLVQDRQSFDRSANEHRATIV